MNTTNNAWENKIMTVCGRCGQNIRIPISAKPLIVTCPKCRNEFRYDYRGEFGSQAEYPAGFHIKEILPVIIYLVLLVVSIAISIANKNVSSIILAVGSGIVLGAATPPATGWVWPAANASRFARRCSSASPSTAGCVPLSPPR